MFRIGEFSTLSRISIKTLRHYDELGLLKPALTDPQSGYRYYSASQLPRLHRILALRDLGFPLNSIGGLLNAGNDDTIRGMLAARQAEQEVRVQEEIERLVRVKAQLRLIESEGLAGDVVLKEIPAQRIVSIRDVIPAHRMIGLLIGRLHALLKACGMHGAGLVIWHDSEYKDEDLDVEAGVFLDAGASPSLHPTGGVSARELEDASVASIVHHGAFSRISEAYRMLLAWIGANGYRPAGPVRELFLQVSVPANRNDESNVTEIQVPVVRA